MSHFHPLTVRHIHRETPESVVIELDNPNHSVVFDYKSGQYLTFSLNINGEELHRSYSICSAPHENKLQVAVKEVEKGRVSTFLNRNLKSGDQLMSMIPMGNFFVPFQVQNRKHYVFFAAGSGITPVISLIKTTLQEEPNSIITLFYGNRSSSGTIFKSELDILAQNDRFKIFYIYSNNESPSPLFSGRINFGKTLELINNFCNDNLSKEYFICGPAEMIQSVSEALKDNNVNPELIHFEYFAPPTEKKIVETIPAELRSESDFNGEAKLEVVLDDRTYNFNLNTKGNSVLDAVLDQGADAPYSCKGGVCTTCRAKIIEGSVKMDSNFALTDSEIKGGYILTCQSHPTSSVLKISYDV